MTSDGVSDVNKQQPDEISPASGVETEKPTSSSNIELERQLTGMAAEDFKPSKRLYVAFLTLAVITLMVALDATSLSVALPVSSTTP